MTKILNRIWNSFLSFILISIMIGGLCFFIPLTDYAWNFSGWQTIPKLIYTMPLMIWIATIALIWWEWKYK